MAPYSITARGQQTEIGSREEEFPGCLKRGLHSGPHHSMLLPIRGNNHPAPAGIEYIAMAPTYILERMDSAKNSRCVKSLRATVSGGKRRAAGLRTRITRLTTI